MEFWIQGKLDPAGRIESVQSSCQSVDGLPGLAGIGDRKVESSAGAGRDRKQEDLVYTLHSKTNEMSLLMVQNAQLMENNKLQRKLLDEYERKFERQENEIRRLRFELGLKRRHRDDDNDAVPRTAKTASSATNRKSVRTSTSIQMTCSLTCTSETEVKSLSWPTMHLSSLEPQCNQAKTDAFMNSETDESISDSVDFVDDSPQSANAMEKLKQENDIREAQNQDVVIGETGSECFDDMDGLPSSECEKESSAGDVLLPLDNYGYLVLECGEARDEQISINLKSVHRLQKPGTSADGDADDDAYIAPTTTEVRLQMNKCSPPSAHPHVQDRTPLDDSRYASIPDELVEDSTVTTPTSSPKYNNDAIYGFPANRHSSPDLSKSDKGTANLVRIMKTTMEWHEARKALMAKSTSCTCEKAEEVLRYVLQECCNVINGKLEGATKYQAMSDKEKLKVVKRLIKNRPGADCIRSAFLIKCLQICNGHFFR